MQSIEIYATEKLASLEAKHLRRVLIDTARDGDIWVKRSGKKILSFSCNDYLNLTQRPSGSVQHLITEDSPSPDRGNPNQACDRVSIHQQ